MSLVAAPAVSSSSSAGYSPDEYRDQKNDKDREAVQYRRPHGVGFFHDNGAYREIMRRRIIDDNNTGLARHRCGKAHRVINRGHLNPNRSFGKDRQS